MTDTKAICDYLMANYNFINAPDYEVMYKALENSQDRMIYKIEHGKVKGMAIYLKITKDSLRDLTIEDLFDFKRMIELSRENGQNVHFIQICTKGTKTILRGMREIIAKENPETISWFRPDLAKLVIRRLSCRRLLQ